VNAVRFHAQDFNRSVIGKWNFLEESTRPDISYVVHLCERFSPVPKKEHAEALNGGCGGRGGQRKY
jgi:hypothetical protein